MATIKVSYANAATITLSTASLASDTNLLAGRESTWVDNSSNLYLDALVSGKVTTGTSPTASRLIEICAIGIQGDATYPDVFDGTDSNETITSSDIKTAICRPVITISTSNTSDRTYPFGPISIASIFGGTLPKSWGLFVVHNTGVNLNSTAGNHLFEYVGVYRTSA